MKSSLDSHLKYLKVQLILQRLLNIEDAELLARLLRHLSITKMVHDTHLATEDLFGPL